MKTYKLIIELSDSVLEKMTSIEKVLEGKDSGISMLELIAMMAVKKEFEKRDSITINVDNVVDDKELALIKSAIVNIGVVSIPQKANTTEKKQQEQKILKSSVGSQTSSLYNPNSSYYNPDCAEDSDGEYKLKL